MKDNFTGETLISVILVVILTIIINPLHLWMPNQAHMMMLVILGILFMVFAIFVWREKGIDERDNLHKSIASRFSYLTGTGLLVITIIIQSLNQTLDVSLIFILGAMILAKIVGLLYAKMKY